MAFSLMPTFSCAMNGTQPSPLLGVCHGSSNRRMSQYGLHILGRAEVPVSEHFSGITGSLIRPPSVPCAGQPGGATAGGWEFDLEAGRLCFFSPPMSRFDLLKCLVSKNPFRSSS